MLTGNLKSFSLVSLLQICDTEQKSGGIILTSKNHSSSCGSIFFDHGAPVYAHYNSYRGLDAIKQIHVSSHHDFNFEEGQKIPERNVNVELNIIILECTRYKDECARHINLLRAELTQHFGQSEVEILGEETTCMRSFSQLNNILSFRKIKFYQPVDNENSFVFFDKIMSSYLQVKTEQTVFTDEIIKYLRSKGLLS